MGNEGRLGGKTAIPPVAQTALWSNAVLWSEEAKKIILIKLPVPWQITGSLAWLKGPGWQAWLFPVNVGCRGFADQLVRRMLTAIGVTGRERNTAVCRMGEAAERAS